MLDCYTRNGYKVETDGIAMSVIDPQGRVAGAYHPMQGDVVLGIRAPNKVLEIMEALEDGRRLISRSPHPVQCE